MSLRRRARGGLAVRSAGLTDRGSRRPVNEDAVLVAPPLVAVADGMGGHAGGEVAADIALRELGRWSTEPGVKRSEALAEAVRRANAAVLSAGSAAPALGDMGCALTAAWFHRGQVSIAHVGDTRAYLLCDGHLEQLTNDMTVAARLAQEQGEEARDLEGLPGGNVLTDAIGRKDISIQTLTRRLEIGSRILLCTDGLHRQVSEEDIVGVLRESSDTETACQRLVAAANAAGGVDNVAVALVDVEPAPEGPLHAESAVLRLGRRWSTIAAVAVVAVLALVIAAVLAPSTEQLVVRLDGDRLDVVRQTSVIGPWGRSEDTVTSRLVDRSRLPYWITPALEQGIPLRDGSDLTSLARDIEHLAAPSPMPDPAPSPSATPSPRPTP